jgi:hypothetical protein
MVQQMEAVGHLAGRRRPEASGFRLGLGALPHAPLNARMRLQPPGDRRGLSVREEGEGTPPFKIQQEGAVGRALAQGTIVHAENWWGNPYGARGATDHPHQGVPTDGKAERLTQSAPRCPTEG